MEDSVYVKEIPNYSGYFAGIDGHVYTAKFGKGRRITRIKANFRDRRLVCKLFVNGKRKSFAISQLIALAYLPISDPKLIVCHNNGNPKDNVYWNLRYDTHKNNSADRIIHGTNMPGSKNHQSKLKEADIVIILDSKDSNSILAKRFNVSRSCIWQIRSPKGNNWKFIKNA